MVYTTFQVVLQVANIFSMQGSPYYFLFSDNLAENLADDMQKECLKGRTLTLKLKTAAFEVTLTSFCNRWTDLFVSWLTRLMNHLNQVRTRAATAPNYISSKEDILIYAKKLLKAELPLSLRLMGRCDL
jgi:Ca2+-transporting ATPase/DNA polymerase kappa